VYGIKSTLEEGIKKPTMGSPNPEKVAEYIRMAKNNLEEEHSKLKEVV